MRVNRPSCFIKVRKILPMVFSAFILSLAVAGCSAEIKPGVQRIIPPANRNLPIYGTWKVDKCLESNFKSMDREKAQKWLGKTVEFTGSSVRFGSQYWSRAEFKIKRVASNDYFFYALRLQSVDTGIKNQNIDIITVSSRNKFLYELIRLKPELLLVKYEDAFLYLVKESGKVTGGADRIEPQREKDVIEASEETKILKSGVLLGIKTLTGSDRNGLSNYTYRTLWISASDRKVQPVLKVNDILLPRKSGFWKLQVQRKPFGNGFEDIIKTSGIDGSSGAKPAIQTVPADFWMNREGLLTKSLLYAGNDYICLEVKGAGRMAGTDEIWTEQYLQTKPVDNPENTGRGIQISDLCGRDGITAYVNSKKRAAESYAVKPAEALNKSNDTDNFSLYRNKGHWFFKGMLDFSNGNTKASAYYDINLIPPESLVFYDLLSVPWTNVKDRVPEARDVFTSPNEDIAVIVESGKLLVYSIEQKSLSGMPLLRMDLPPGDTVVMAEWATGNYVDNWREVIASNSAAAENNLTAAGP